jgi:DNA-binding IscR family transcriptional regulator
MTECSIEEGLCSQEDSCGLRGNWQRISLAVADALQQVTLAEMGAPTAPKANPLHITTLNVS